MVSPVTDLFHEMVCSWCLKLWSRIRDLAAEFNPGLRHRAGAHARKETR